MDSLMDFWGNHDTTWFVSVEWHAHNYAWGRLLFVKQAAKMGEGDWDWSDKLLTNKVLFVTGLCLRAIAAAFICLHATSYLGGSNSVVLLSNMALKVVKTGRRMTGSKNDIEHWVEVHSLSTLPSGVSIHNFVLSLDFHSRNVTFVFNIPQVVSHRPSSSNQNQIQIKYSTKIAIMYYLIWTKFCIVYWTIHQASALLYTYFILNNKISIE